MVSTTRTGICEVGRGRWVRRAYATASLLLGQGGSERIPCARRAEQIQPAVRGVQGAADKEAGRLREKSISDLLKPLSGEELGQEAERAEAVVDFSAAPELEIWSNPAITW